MASLDRAEVVEVLYRTPLRREDASRFAVDDVARWAVLVIWLSVLGVAVPVIRRVLAMPRPVASLG